jgi:glucose/arabinose dehydrogenase
LAKPAGPLRLICDFPAGRHQLFSCPNEYELEKVERKEFRMRKFLHLLLALMILPWFASGVSAQSTIGDPKDIEIRQVAEGLTAPVFLVEAPDSSGRLFILDQVGQIRILTAVGELLEEPFLDVSDRIVGLMTGFDERGLLGLAFHPGYASNGRFFVYYSAPLRPGAPTNFNHTSHISEFHVSADPDRADPDSERVLLQVDQPQFNHNAGALAFGPEDGFLYIALGDGGGANDVGVGHTPNLGNAQDFSNLLGSILRIDVDSGDPYGIPPDNPFVGTEGRDEIFAYGLRNPYRMSFDMGGSRDLFAADAGQLLWEEVSIISMGNNYGWNIKEGTHCFDPDNPEVSPEQCPDTGPLLGEPLIDPIIEYANIRQPGGIGTVVVGGFVYRGSLLPQLSERYVFADWSTSFVEADGTLLVASPRKDRLWHIQELSVKDRPDGRLGHFILGFGQDMSGEIYVLTSDNTGPTGETGRVYLLVRPGRGPFGR